NLSERQVALRVDMALLAGVAHLIPACMCGFESSRSNANGGEVSAGEPGRLERHIDPLGQIEVEDAVRPRVDRLRHLIDEVTGGNSHDDSHRTQSLRLGGDESDGIDQATLDALEDREVFDKHQ